MATDSDHGSGKVDAYGLPVTVKHFRPPSMRHSVWEHVHALETPIERGPKTFTHVCLLCVRAKAGAWQDALCRISNASNAMKHMKSRHKDWDAANGASAAGSATASAEDEDATASEGDADGDSPRASPRKSKSNPPNPANAKPDDAASSESSGSKRKASEKQAVKETKKPATDTKVAVAASSTAATSLSGKVVVITGASGGIGAAIAKKLAMSGAKVALGARRLSALEEIRDSIAEAAGSTDSVLVRATDVTKREDLHNLVKAATDRFGDVDILVNNAGVMPFELLRNVNQDSWDRIIDINCKGVLNGIAAVLPRMLERKAGHIVNISSDAGRRTFPGLGVYSASKMFVEGVSQALRLENVGSGLRVTCIQPGNVATDLVQHGHSMSGVDEEAMKLYGAPSGYQVLQPEDIANAVHYAVTQPPFVAVNEILVEPRDEPI